jgi:hydroxymethylbilane synthase
MQRQLQPVLGQVEIVTIRTSGDKGNRDLLGAFVKEIQESLLRDEVDLALHCLKDLPTQQVPGLRLAAYLEREDPRDAILTRGESWLDLPRGSVVGTGSVRRTSQLASHRPDLSFKPLLGNVDTRLRKLQEGDYDAIVLAIAGLKRLGLVEDWSASEYGAIRLEPLEFGAMLPAPGQAVLVVEGREDDRDVQERLAAFDHRPSRASADAERAFLKRFGGGCSVPVAAHAVADGDALQLTGLVAVPDGSRVLRGEATGTIAEALSVGERLADELGARGAFDLFERTALRTGGTEH